MKVLHYEHMGVGVILSKALRKLGVHSRVLSSAPHPFGFKEDYLFSQKLYMRKFLRRLEWRKYYGFNILHSHDNNRLPQYVLKRWRGALIQHYHDPHTKNSLYDNVPSFVSLPNILKAVPEATWIPIPVDTNFFRPKKTCKRNKVCIGFYDQKTEPNKYKFIPKTEIKKAANKLGNKVLMVPLNKIIPYRLIRSYYNQIDIWVDRIGCDFYGFTAVEIASMCKPVITQIGEEEQDWVTNCPFINTDREGVTETIIKLVEDERFREFLGEKAREYVVEVHDSTKVALKCLEKYKGLCNMSD
jgi:hypothetical protein